MAGAVMRKPLLLICVLGIPWAAWAENKATSWENLNTLQADEKIQVVEMNSKKVSGTFLNVSDAAISLQEKAGQQTIQRQDVRSVKLMKHQHRLRNTLIGAAVGFGAGAGVGAAAAHPCSPSQPYCLTPGRGIPAAFGGVIGLAGGAVVGALVPSHKTIYLVNPQ
jgi:thiamine pyrophosphate-dependent acetolactate synthase large subunit-like protein